eukprot:3285109-Alexandrium_andersonii.AAC.1
MMRAGGRACARVRVRLPACVRAHACTRACLRAPAPACVRACARARACVCARVRVCVRQLGWADARACVRGCACVHACARVHFWPNQSPQPGKRSCGLRRVFGVVKNDISDPPLGFEQILFQTFLSSEPGILSSLGGVWCARERNVRAIVRQGIRANASNASATTRARFFFVGAQPARHPTSPGRHGAIA